MAQWAIVSWPVACSPIWDGGLSFVDMFSFVDSFIFVASFIFVDSFICVDS